MFFITRLLLANTRKKKIRDHRARLREKEYLFEEDLLDFVRTRAHVRELMTQKSCAGGMRNAILQNNLTKRVVIK